MPGQRVDIFNAIAHHLVRHGIGSLRYDKRGCAKSTGNYLSAGQTDFVADAVACVDRLLTHEQCLAGQVFLLGHSEGCLIAPRVSLQREDVAGIVALCPPLRSFESVLLQQAAQIERELAAARGIRGWFYRVLSMFGSVVERQGRLIARIKATSSPTLRLGLQKVAARSLRELMELDPRALYSQVRCSPSEEVRTCSATQTTRSQSQLSTTAPRRA